jgi:hypothetical protein
MYKIKQGDDQMSGRLFKKSMFAFWFIVVSAFMVSCTTFSGPLDFVDYKIPKGAKRSEQSSLINNKLDKYYEDEFTYDEKGNIVKVKQVEYIEPDKSDRKFIVWETEWKVYGDAVVPSRVLCNGIEFCTVEWQLLSSQNKGEIKQDIKTRYYSKKNGLLFPDYEFWRVDLKEYPVPSFMSDDKFVKREDKINYYEKIQINVLAMGYNNVVLSRYSFSYNKLASGMAKTYSVYSYNHYRLNNLSGRAEVEFQLKWKVIADIPCLDKLKYSAKMNEHNSDFAVDFTYNEKGNRKSEEWIVTKTNFSGQEEPVSIFKQVLSY